MAVIQPFRAIRYSARELTGKLAPPYDVLSADDKAALLARDRHNFVAIDLPHVPPKDAGPPAAYEGAARTLSQWLEDGTLTRDAQPAIYVYHQQFEHAGRSYRRKMFFARLRLEPFGTGKVFPHEQTFGGPKEDRLLLTKATRTNLSPIFGLYPDSEHDVARLLDGVTGGTPLAEGQLDATHNRMWALVDPAVVTRLAALMQERPTFIADGHHRYGTGLMYRDSLTQQPGGLASNHPANYVLCVFCALEDAGLLILPTHRVLPRAQVSAAWFERDAKLEVRPLEVKSADAAVAALPPFGPQALALYDADGRYFMIRPRDPKLLEPIAAEHSPAWRGLALALLHAYLLDRVVRGELGLAGQPEIQYIKAAGPAVQAARDGGGAAFLLQATTMAELRAVCEAGDLMPQKSTYFFPKLASGLVINPLGE